jgi:hypothetical protein
MVARKLHGAENFCLWRQTRQTKKLKNKKMEKMNKDLFGKFETNKIDSLSSIKGGLVVGDSSTTLCKTTESTFDTDSTANQENLSDKRCEALA